MREAFRLLAASGLVELRGRQGAVVRSIGAHALIEMFQVMAEMEGLCARLAARRITPAQMDKLRAIHEKLEQVATLKDIDLFYDVNQEFHEALYEASANAFLPTRPAGCAIRWPPIGAVSPACRPAYRIPCASMRR